MIVNIFRNNILVVGVKPLDSSELQQRKQEYDLIRLNFVLDYFENFEIGDYISFEKTGQLYRLNSLPRVVENSMNYQYECIFESGLHNFKKVKCFLETKKVNSDTAFYTDYCFALTGNAKTFLDFIVNILNRVYSGFTAGICKETEIQTIEFNNWNVFEAIYAIAALLNFEWYLDATILNFDKPKKQSTFVFSVGRGGGFTSLSRLFVESTDFYTVLYGYGSSNNLPTRETFDSPLLKENRLFFVGTDNESKLTKNVDKYGVIEQVKEYEIQPQFFGTVTNLSDSLLEFFDNTIEFDVNDCIIANIQPKITFTSGLLNGTDFNITFVNDSKKFTVTEKSDDTGTFPNSVIKIQVGDSYVLTDITLPDSYIQNAQQRLYDAVLVDLNANSKPKELFEAILDEVVIQSNGIELFIGDLIRVISGQFAIDNLYEIKELTQSITNPFLYTIKFGDLLPKSLLATIRNNEFNLKQQIYNVSNTQITNTDVTNITGDIVAWDSL